MHVADLAAAFRRVLEDDSARGYYVIGNGTHPTVAELTEAAAVAVGAPGAVPGSDAEARARLGDYFAEVLLVDQGTAAAKTRDELGWHPTRPSLVSEFRHGQLPALAAQPHPSARNRTKVPIRHRYGQPVTKPLQTGKHLARTPGARPRERIT